MFPTRLTIAAALIAAPVLVRANEVPKAYPSFDQDRAATAIVVARVSAGGELPDFPQCNRPQVICLHAPFWFKAHVLQTMAGKVDEPVLNVSTESHDSMKSYVREPSTQLLRLKLHDGQAYLPLYEFRRLYTRRDGELYLVLTGGRLPDWLPCSAPDLSEPIVGSDFSPDLSREPDEDTGMWEDTEVARHPEIWRIEADRAWPRNGIRIARLREMMRGLAARNEPTDCRTAR